MFHGMVWLEIFFPESGRLMVSNKLWRRRHCLMYYLNFRINSRIERAAAMNFLDFKPGGTY